MVNISDVDKVNSEETSSSGDMLKDIFDGQKSLMKNYLPIAEDHFEKVFGSKVKISPEAWEGGEFNLHTKTGNFLIKDMIDACIHELSETVQTLKNWKPWKQTEMQTDSNHFKEELIDSVHFLIEACILSGITPKDLYETYFKKNKVNQFRQESNY